MYILHIKQTKYTKVYIHKLNPLDFSFFCDIEIEFAVHFEVSLAVVNKPVQIQILIVTEYILYAYVYNVNELKVSSRFSCHTKGNRHKYCIYCINSWQHSMLGLLGSQIILNGLCTSVIQRDVCVKIIVNKVYLIWSSLWFHSLGALRSEACRSAQDMVKCEPKHLDTSSDQWNRDNSRSRSLWNPATWTEEAGESNALGLEFRINYPKSAWIFNSLAGNEFKAEYCL